MMIKLEKVISAIVFMLVIFCVFLMEIDMVMKVSAIMLVVIYWELEDISEKLD